MNNKGKISQTDGKQIQFFSKEELLNQIKKYFENKASFIEVKEVYCCPDEFLFELDAKLTEDEYKEFHKFLKRLGFLLRDEFEYQVATKPVVKYTRDEKFTTEDNRTSVFVFYVKVKDNENILYYIKFIEVKFRKKKK